MDHTTFDIYILMVIVMACASYLIPKAAPGVSRTGLIVGFVPSLALMLAGAHVQSQGGRPWDCYATGLMAMFCVPMAVVAVAAIVRKRRTPK